MTTDTKQIVNTSTFSSTNTLTDNTVINSIPSELLCQIFFHFSFDSNTSSSFSSSSSSSSLNFTNQRTNLKTLLSCCLVNRQWCSNAISILYSDTFSHYRFIDTNKLIETYLKCIFCYYNKYEKDEHRNNNEDEDEDEDENVNSSSSLLPSLLNLHDIITNSHHPTISRYHSSSSTLFDYPLYLKHLDYYGLIISIKKFLSLHSLYTFDQSPNSDITLYNNDLHNWTDITGLYNKHNNNNNDDDNDNNDYDNDNHNSIIIDGVINSNNNNNNNDKSQREQQEQLKNYLIKRFLKLFYDRKSRITSLKIENTCPLNKEEEYLLWCNDDDHDNNSNSNNNENYSLLFKNLRKLFIKVNFCQDNLFSKLKDVCNNLETLKVNMSNLIASNRKTESQNLATLISSQINLKHFELHGFECSIELILPSLTSQSRSLQVLILEYLDFRDCDNNSLASILDCRKLQVLKFISCTNLNKEVFECLEEGTKNNNRGTCGEHGDNYWNELKEVYVTPNMCEEMRSWARKIRNKINNNNNDNRYYNKVNPYIFLIPVYIKY